MTSERPNSIKATHDPFGMAMPERSVEAGSGYRYGFNGQEEVDEMHGQNGSHTTALYWEYDSRLGRRWNLDPKPQVKVSDYACFMNNPILFVDILGDKVEYERGRDKINAFFGRLFSKVFRDRFKSLNDLDHVYVLRKRAGENWRSMKSGGSIQSCDELRSDWFYTPRLNGRGDPGDVGKLYQQTIITIEELNNDIYNVGKASYSGEFFVPEGTPIEYNTLQVPDNVVITDASSGAQVYESSFDPANDHVNPDFTEFQNENPNYRATTCHSSEIGRNCAPGDSWRQTSNLPGGKYVIDINQNGLPIRDNLDHEGNEQYGNTQFKIRINEGGLIIRERTRNLPYMPKEAIKVKRK